jgi:hypothetical protein
MTLAGSTWLVRIPDTDDSTARLRTMLTRCTLVEKCAKLGVDERVILGIIMQESHGNVGASTEYN